jgi:hypothetical protein
MCSFPVAAPLIAAALIASSPVLAQELQINQRFTAPTAQADTFTGVTLGRLILALGLSLQGVPPDVRSEALKNRLHVLAEPERRAGRAKAVPAPGPMLASQPVVPAIASAEPAATVVPAVVQAEPATAK